MADQNKENLKEKEALGIEEGPKRTKVIKVAPDGGFGWIIVCATALSSFITIPVMQSFGLLFQDAFTELNMSATDLSVIINVNSAFGMGLGLLNGPLLRRFGYRKVSLGGAICYFVGLTATSWAKSFVHFLITYSLITSAGGFMLMAGFSLAMNTYFTTRRGRAAGISSTLTGLGPVMMPQLITFLLKHYNVQDTTLILGAITLHSVIAALLLQPVEWHMKKVVVEEEDEEKQPVKLEEEEKPVAAQEGPQKRIRRNTAITEDGDYDHDVDTRSIYGFETPLISHRPFGSSQQLAGKRKLSTASCNRSISQVDDSVSPGMVKIQHAPSSYSWWESIDSINLGSSVKIFDEKPYYPLKQMPSNSDLKEEKENDMQQSAVPVIIVGDSVHENNNNVKSFQESDHQNNSETKQEKNLCTRIGKSIVNFFDLGLLRDPGYVILMLGMSIAVCAELNFSLFTPMILADYGFTLGQTATVMSIIGIADIVFRFLAPFVGDFLKFTAQSMYLLAMVMLLVTRTALMIYHDYNAAITVAVFLGIAKGFRTVYMTVVIPSYVPLERLASASGLQMVVNSLFIVASIPVMAFVRDFTGSYNMCIGALNCLTFTTICMWTSQIVYKKLKNKNKTT